MHWKEPYAVSTPNSYDALFGAAFACRRRTAICASGINLSHLFSSVWTLIIKPDQGAALEANRCNASQYNIVVHIWEDTEFSEVPLIHVLHVSRLHVPGLHVSGLHVELAHVEDHAIPELKLLAIRDIFFLHIFSLFWILVMPSTLTRYIIRMEMLLILQAVTTQLESWKAASRVAASSGPRAPEVTQGTIVVTRDSQWWFYIHLYLLDVAAIVNLITWLEFADIRRLELDKKNIKRRVKINRW